MPLSSNQHQRKQPYVQLQSAQLSLPSHHHSLFRLLALVLLQLLPLSTFAFSLLDCRTIQSGRSLPISQPLPVSTSGWNVQLCVDVCSMVSTQFALLGGNTCRCILSLATLDQTMHAVNTPECSLDCSDGLPCGSSAALNRFSVYNVTEASLPATNPTSSLSSSSLPPMSTQSNGPTGPSNESVGPGKSINQQQIAIIVGILGGIVICAAIFIILFRRHRKLKATPATPTIDVAGSNDYLIPKLLPRTPNQLYSVHAPYTARRADEMSIEPKQVLAIRNTYSDGWAMGTDLSNGVAGVFPLACLIPDRAKAPMHALIIPERTQESIHISMVPPPLAGTD